MSMNSIQLLMKVAIGAGAMLLLGGDVKKGVVGDHGTVTGVRRGAEVIVTVAAVPGWKLNVEYPPRLRLGSDKWGPADVKWRDAAGGKAAAGEWRVKSAAGSGDVKVVFCSPTACTAPETGVFDVK